MTDPIDWDARRMFDRYVYDYLRKRNMHRSAESFRIEANVNIDPAFPISIDVRDGFLHEWWLPFYDMVVARQVKNSEHGHGSHLTGTVTASKACSLEQYEDSPQTLECIAFGPDYGRVRRNNLLQLRGWPFTGQPLATGLQSNQQEIVTCKPEIVHSTGLQSIQRELATCKPKIVYSTGDLFDMVASSAYVSQPKKPRNDSKPCNFDDGSGMRGVDEASSDAPELLRKSGPVSAPSSCDEDGKGSASPDASELLKKSRADSAPSSSDEDGKGPASSDASGLQGKSRADSLPSISGEDGKGSASPDASELLRKSRADSAPSSSDEDGKGSAFSGNLPESSESLEGNSSEGGCVERHPGQVSTTSCRLHPSPCSPFGNFLNSPVT